VTKFDYRAALIGGVAACSVFAESKAMALAMCLVPLAVLTSFWLLAGTERWVSAFFFAAILLPPLPFALGNSGPHVAMGIALIGMLVGLAYVGEWRLHVTTLTTALLLFTAVVLCSVGWAAIYSGPSIALASMARALLFGIAIYVFLYTRYGPAAAEPQRQVRLLFGFAVLAALFACLDFYYQFPAPGGFSPQFVWLDTGVFRRAQGLFYEASTLGNFCAFFLTMIGVCIVRPAKDRPVALPWLIAGGVLLGAAVVLSYSRGSVVNLAISGAALGMLRKKRGPVWRPALTFVLSGASACFICYLIVPQLFSAYTFRLWNSVLYSTSSTNGVLSGRLDHWRTILDFLAANPWHLLLGVGYKTLPYSDFTGVAVIADNTYLSTIAETGLIGFGALLFLLYAILRAGYTAAKDPDPQRSFFGTWTFCFWCGQVAQMFSGDLLTYWRVLPIYLWVLALAAR
jgi:O-antigen ligase